MKNKQQVKHDLIEYSCVIFYSQNDDDDIILEHELSFICTEHDINTFVGFQGPRVSLG